MSETDSMSIPIGPGMRAFAAGVVAGEEAREYARGASTPREQLAAFWMLVGARLAETQPGADEEVQTGFAAGAATNAPPRIMARPESPRGAISTAWRVSGLTQFLDATYEPGQVRTNLVDLLVDAMHYAQAHGLDLDDVLVSARNHYSAERGQ